MESDKRRKSNAFSVEEQLRLLDLIASEKHIVENKTTNKLTNDEKDQAWQRITTAFNAVAVHRRNTDQLKSKYDNLKTKTRKVVAAQRSYIKGTGGGAPVCDKFDPVVETILKIINMKTVVGFDNISDCDNDVDTEIGIELNDMPKTSDVTNVGEQVSDLPIFIINDFNNQPSGSDTPVEIISVCKDNEESVMQPCASNSEIVNKATTPESVKKLKRKWSNYTPYKLKEPITKKLRPTITNPTVLAKEEYYKKKVAFLETQTWAIREENRRQEEAHIKKQVLLDLEIKLKEDELKQKCTEF